MLTLSAEERSIINGETGTTAQSMAMQIVAQAGDMLGAKQLIPIVSSHIDGCLYHGDSGVLFCERLAQHGGRVKVPTTTNVGALNLLKPDQVNVPADRRKMAFRLMQAHDQMGCKPTWTCAPYQAGARPAVGSQVAWGESNAVAFVNTVLGARTNRYGDFLDISCAIIARAPDYGLHQSKNRRAKLIIDTCNLSEKIKHEDAFYPVLGALIGRLAGNTVAVVTGLPALTNEDQLKALCAGAASTGAVALVHIAGVTPEATDVNMALAGEVAVDVIKLSIDDVIAARNSLSLVGKGAIDCVAVGSPHFSAAECRQLLQLICARKLAVPFYVCTSRYTLGELAVDGTDIALIEAGIEFVADTCVVVTPILPAGGGVMMTNSAKFAHYASGNTGYQPVFGALADCVESAIRGLVVWDAGIWA